MLISIMEIIRGFQIINKPLVFDETCALSYKSRISVVILCLARVEANTWSQEVPNISEQFNNYKFVFQRHVLLIQSIPSAVL